MNGILQNNTNSKRYVLNGESNRVIIGFNNKVETCENMFNGLNNIIEVDLSSFDASNAIKFLEQNLVKCHINNLLDVKISI